MTRLRVLWLLPDLGYNAPARQAALVVPALRAIGLDVSVASMYAGPGLGEGLEVPNLATPHDLPIRVLVELERLLRTEPFDLIHAWRLPALRAIVAVRMKPGRHAKLLVSEPRQGGRFTPIDRFLLRRADRIAADDSPKAIPDLTPAPWPRPLRLPDDAQVIACLGEFDRAHYFRDAVWAFDVLKFVYPRLHLVFIGDGPERLRVHEFSQALGGEAARVRFVTDRGPGPNLLHHADLVWIPRRAAGGDQVALEARSIGVPVVATSVVPGDGIRVPAGDPVALAKASRPILDGPRRPRVATTASQQDRNQSVATFWKSLYSEVAGP